MTPPHHTSARFSRTWRKPAEVAYLCTAPPAAMMRSSPAFSSDTSGVVCQDAELAGRPGGDHLLGIVSVSRALGRDQLDRIRGVLGHC